MLASLLPLVLVLAAMVLLPLLGAALSGAPLAELLALPLQSRGWDPLPTHASPTAVAAAASLVLVAAVLWRARPVRSRSSTLETASAGTPTRWPRYGWLAPLALIAAVAAVDGDAINLACGLMVLALTLAANAHTERLTGNSLLRQRPGYFYSLFAVSLVFGWAFYWLNLYLRLWVYPQAQETVPFVLGKSLDYAVLLPALVSLRQWLASAPWLLRAVTSARPLAGRGSAEEGVLLLAAGALALLGAPLWPDWIFPLALLAPLLLALGLQLTGRRPTLLAGLASGDWSRVLLPAAAALLLGLVTQGCNLLLGPAWEITVPLIGGPAPFGIPVAGWLLLALLGLLGVWLADQVTRPWQQRPQQPPHRSRFPVQVAVEPPNKSGKPS